MQSIQFLQVRVYLTDNWEAQYGGFLQSSTSALAAHQAAAAAAVAGRMGSSASFNRAGSSVIGGLLTPREAGEDSVVSAADVTMQPVAERSTFVDESVATDA